MRKLYKMLLMLIGMAAFTACDDKLDIVPKGQTTLSNVTDLEYLLNQEYGLGAAPSSDLGMICNESLGMGINIPDVLTQHNTLNYAYLTYNESVDRVSLTLNDDRYSQCYKYINYMNVILEKLPDAEGDDSKKVQLEAEAKVMRAYFHWLLVNIHAKQYDEATAETDGGIPYCDNADATEEKTKLSVATVYNRILEDCSDEVIAALPLDDGENVLRADRAFGNAVRAKVLMQMKRYGEALPYAEAALEINGTIDDRSVIKETGSWSLSQDAADNYVYINDGTRVNPCMEILSWETGGGGASTSGDFSFGDDDEDDWDDEDDYYYDAKPTTGIATKSSEGNDESGDGDGDDDYNGDEDENGDETQEADNGLFEKGDYVLTYDAMGWSALYGQLMAGISAKYCFAFGVAGNAYGITSDRMYYTAAECMVRTGRIRDGLALVDKVRAYRVEDYQPFVELYDASPMTEQEAMALLQKAKWIECIGSYENFFDCKRWNTEADYQRTITRNLGEDLGTYSIAPTSPLWVLPFPANATRYNSSLTQNY